MDAFPEMPKGAITYDVVKESKRRKNKKSSTTIISNWTLFIIKCIINLGCVLFYISPCKWNRKKNRFQTDNSKWNFTCRCIHLSLRICGLFIIIIYWLIFRRISNVLDIILSILTVILLSTMISIHIKGFNNPRYLASIFNGIIQLNNKYGLVTTPEDISKLKSLEFYFKLLMCMGPLGVALFPFGAYQFLKSEVSDIFKLVFDIVMFILQIPDNYRYLLYIMFTVAVELTIVTEITLWGAYTFSNYLFTYVASYCLEKQTANNNNHIELFNTNNNPKIVEQANNFYCQLRVIGNIVEHTLFTIYYLAYILLKELTVAFLLFFVIKYFKFFKNEGGWDLLILLAAFLFAGLGMLIDDNRLSRQAFLVTQKSMHFKYSFLCIYYNNQNYYEQCLIIKSWQAMKFNIAETLELDQAFFLKLLNDFTVNILITLLLSYGKIS